MGTLTLENPNEKNSYKDSIECVCGSNSYLETISKTGHYYDKTIIVRNVPVYRCPSCGEEMIMGSDSIRFADKVEEAALSGKAEIEF